MSHGRTTATFYLLCHLANEKQSVLSLVNFNLNGNIALERLSLQRLSFNKKTSSLISHAVIACIALITLQLNGQLGRASSSFTTLHGIDYGRLTTEVLENPVTIHVGNRYFFVVPRRTTSTEPKLDRLCSSRGANADTSWGKLLMWTLWAYWWLLTLWINITRWTAATSCFSMGNRQRCLPRTWPGSMLLTWEKLLKCRWHWTLR